MILHLSRLRLDPRSPQVRSELRHPYEMHRTLAKAFASPDTPPAEAREALAAARVLFRVDDMVGTPVALVQSRVAPRWAELTPKGAYLAAPPEMREFAPRADVGTRLVFRLRANPTVKRNGKRFGLYGEPEQIQWLVRKGVSGGFALLQATVITEARRQRGLRRDGSVEHLAVRFDGVLQVSDGAAFTEALAGGIGSAKGFGFGLLSVAPFRA